MRKHMPWWLILALCACQSTLDPDSQWIEVNHISWAAMSDMPYPFTADYGEIACDSYADLKLAYFYPYDTGDDEAAAGVPLTSDARKLDKKTNIGLITNVFKDNVDVERLESKVLGICGKLE